jgi:hypothetical protein
MLTAEMPALGSATAAVATAPGAAAATEPRVIPETSPGAGERVDEVVPEKITFEEMDALHRAGEPVVLLDVRTPRTFEADPFIAHGAIRMPPDDAVRLATAHRIPWKATLVAYCA